MLTPLFCIVVLGVVAGLLLWLDEQWLRSEWRLRRPDDHDITPNWKDIR